MAVTEKVVQTNLRKSKTVFESPRKILWRRFTRNKIAVAGLCILVFLVLISAAAPLLTTKNPETINLMNKETAPSAEHLLGTDSLGRDIYARLLYGGRVSMLVGIVATAIQLCIGVTLGSIAGYTGGKIDSLIMRLTDIVLSFPFLPLAMVGAAILGSGAINTMLVIGFLSWTGTCRIVRGQFLQIRSTEYIEATRALGISKLKTVVRHMLPNALAPLLINATLAMAVAILIEAGLSFLGVGVRPPQPSWGNMLEVARNVRIITRYWWMWVPPGLAIFVTVLSINLVGDGLRDALEPRLKL
jgi:peptide/nickel transport system permease protein